MKYMLIMSAPQAMWKESAQAARLGAGSIK
jgi:hypothetical protein